MECMVCGVAKSQTQLTAFHFTLLHLGSVQTINKNKSCTVTVHKAPATP